MKKAVKYFLLFFLLRYFPSCGQKIDEFINLYNDFAIFLIELVL